MIVEILLGLYFLFLIILTNFSMKWGKKSNIPRAKEFNNPNNDTERARQYCKSLDTRYQQRNNYILVAESMLLFSFVTTFLTKTEDLNGIRLAIAFVGTIITVSWLFVNIRLMFQIRKLQISYLLPNDPVFWDYTKKPVHRNPTAVLFLTYLLPNLIVLLWIYLFSFSSGFADSFIEKSILLYIPILVVLNLIIQICLPKNNPC